MFDMASNNIYNVYRRNGTSHNKIESSQSKSNLDALSENANKKSNIDNNIYNFCNVEQEEPKPTNSIILLSDDDLTSFNVRPKRYIKKHPEINTKMETRSITFEATKSNDCKVYKKLDTKNECEIMNPITKSLNCKDGEINVENNVIKGVVQNLLDVAINKNMSRSRKCESSISNKRECRPECTLEGDSLDVVMMDSNDIGIKNEESLKLKTKTELEREMEIYEAFERDEEARVVLRDLHEMPREELDIAVDPSNEKKRALEGNFYERKKKRIKHEQKLVSKTKSGEDVCFICFDGGDLVLCDRRYNMLLHSFCYCKNTICGL